MKKAEYIEKYGEEKWKERLKKVRDWNKKNKDYVSQQKKEYYKNNKIDILSKRKEYYVENKIDILDQRKKYQEENREAISASKKVFRQKNKERISIKRKEKYQKNKEQVCARMIEYRKTKNGRAISICNSYRNRDLQNNYDVSHNIDSTWIVENIFSGQACIYCGDNDWTHLGCDRIDNNKPHTADNLVCSCFICNTEKADRYSVEEFKKYRALHPRACDVPKGPVIELSPSGALKKKSVPD